MNKKSIIFIIICVLGALSCSCGTNPQNNGDDVEKANSVIEMTKDIPYTSYINPTLVGDEMFICVGESEGSVGKVINYNIASKKSKVIFESQFGEASVSNTMANDNWVIWVDSDISGTKNIIYSFNRKSQEILKIAEYEAATDDYVIIAPYLSGDYVGWIGTETGSSAKVMLYNLQNKDYQEIAKLNEHSFYNNFVFLDDGQLLWTDDINGKGYYFVYEIKTKSKKKIEAPYPYPGYAQMSNGLIYSINFEDYHNWTDQDFGSFNISTSMYSSDEAVDTSYINQFRINGGILAVMDSNNELQLLDVQNDKLIDYVSPLKTIDTIDIADDQRVVAGIRATEKTNAMLVILNSSK